MGDLRFLTAEQLVCSGILAVLSVLAALALASTAEFLFGILRTIVALCFTSPNRTVRATASKKWN